MKLLSLFFCLFLVACQSDNELFNGKDLTNWQLTRFGGEGDVIVEKGALRFDYGNPMTGLTWQGRALPKLDYKLEFDAMKVDGNDFFVGVTFPYKESHISLILGGWGGFTCGLSSLNGMDASENDTAFVMKFEKKKWYNVSITVIDDLITVKIDGKKLVDAKIDDRKVDTRPEVEISKPLGFSSFETIASYKNITLTELK